VGGSARSQVIVTALVLLSGLSSCAGAPLACTGIGARAGLSITLAGAPAAAEPGLDLKVCAAEGCTVAEVILSPGSSTASGTCTPDGTCSATSVPDGTTSTHTTAVRPEMVHPNGERCGGGAMQASLILDDGGLRQD
jgi:hypothetical protein